MEDNENKNSFEKRECSNPNPELKNTIVHLPCVKYKHVGRQRLSATSGYSEGDEEDGSWAVGRDEWHRMAKGVREEEQIEEERDNGTRG